MAGAKLTAKARNRLANSPKQQARKSPKNSPKASPKTASKKSKKAKKAKNTCDSVQKKAALAIPAGSERDFDSKWFANGGFTHDDYMGKMTDMFGDELFEMRQNDWDDSKMDLLIDSLEFGKRIWGFPTEIPPVVTPSWL